MRCYGYGPTATAPFHLTLMGGRATETPKLEDGAKGASAQCTKSPFPPSSSVPWDGRDPARGRLSHNSHRQRAVQEEPQTKSGGGRLELTAAAHRALGLERKQWGQGD